MSNAVTTKTARRKFAKAHKGETSLPKIAEIAFGDEGHDVGGKPIDPSGNETEVPGEFIRKSVDKLSLPSGTSLRIDGNLDFGEGDGKQVSSIGIYDDDGDLIALKTFSPKVKDEDTRLEVQWKEKF